MGCAGARRLAVSVALVLAPCVAAAAAQCPPATVANTYWRLWRSITSDFRNDMRSNGYDRTRLNEQVVATIAYRKASPLWHTFARWSQEYFYESTYAIDARRTRYTWRCWGRSNGTSVAATNGKLSFRAMPVTLDNCEWRCVDEPLTGSSGRPTSTDCGNRRPVCDTITPYQNGTIRGWACHVQLLLDVSGVRLVSPPKFGTMQLPSAGLGGSYVGGCEGKGLARQCEQGSADVTADVRWYTQGGDDYVPIFAPRGPLPQLINTKDTRPTITDERSLTKCNAGVVVNDCDGRCLITPR